MYYYIALSIELVFCLEFYDGTAVTAVHLGQVSLVK